MIQDRPLSLYCFSLIAAQAALAASPLSHNVQIAVLLRCSPWASSRIASHRASNMCRKYSKTFDIAEGDYNTLKVCPTGSIC